MSSVGVLVAVLYSDHERFTLLEGIVRTAIGSFLVTAALVATACGTSSPASPSAALLHGDSHHGGSSGGGDNGNGGNSGSNNGGNANHDTEIQGLVTAVGAASITVNGQAIVVDASTTIVHDGKTLKLSDIKTGDRVEIKATISGTTTTATRIQVETPEGNDNGDDDGASHGAGEAEVNGVIIAIGTACPALTLTVGTTKVTTTSATAFEDTTCGALAMGDRVEVKGAKQTDGSIAASSIERQ